MENYKQSVIHNEENPFSNAMMGWLSFPPLVIDQHRLYLRLGPPRGSYKIKHLAKAFPEMVRAAIHRKRLRLLTTSAFLLLNHCYGRQAIPTSEQCELKNRDCL